jgi:serine/threonine-protein kinase
VLLVSALTSFGTSWIVLHSRHASPVVDRVAVPNLVGVAEKDARENLRALGIVLLVGARKPTPDVEADTVIAQSIPPGQQLARGEAITVTFALAVPKLPNLVGRTLDEAKQLLGAQGIELQEGKAVASNDVARGRIVSQDPPAGGAHDKTEPVVVSLSSGPSEIVVPKLLGQPLSKAKETLEAAGLVLGGIVWTELGETPTGIVLNQNPLPDIKAKPGDKVSITINR